MIDLDGPQVVRTYGHVRLMLLQHSTLMAKRSFGPVIFLGAYLLLTSFCNRAVLLDVARKDHDRAARGGLAARTRKAAPRGGRYPDRGPDRIV